MRISTAFRYRIMSEHRTNFRSDIGTHIGTELVRCRNDVGTRRNGISTCSDMEKRISNRPKGFVL